MSLFQFVKMQGAGNDYVYVDCTVQACPADPSRLAQAISDRHFGVGSDGLILILPSEQADAKMRMFNADGSEGQMCGNGIRCVAKYVFESGIARRNPLKIETGRGILVLELSAKNGKVSEVTVDMGEPILDTSRVPAVFPVSPAIDQPLEIDGRIFLATAISMGNPHCVIFQDRVTDDDVLVWGPRIERSHYFPERVNVEFVEVISPTEVRQRTWERGSGETLACGTGASAVCVAGVLTGRTERAISNHLLGGTLFLRWDQATNRMFKTGPAVEVFRGVWQLNP